MLIIVITSGCKNIPFLNVWIHVLVTWCINIKLIDVWNKAVISEKVCGIPILELSNFLTVLHEKYIY